MIGVRIDVVMADQAAQRAAILLQIFLLQIPGRIAFKAELTLDIEADTLGHRGVARRIDGVERVVEIEDPAFHVAEVGSVVGFLRGHGRKMRDCRSRRKRVLSMPG